ncbi:metal-dependent hydrolase [Pseudarthrobacter sp. J1738]|uniref:metal-dependent hydrolase n=1 Tax=Pseudarthrobacter sp. J1738 TaxID=3420446 RepID=UPI003D2D81CD
MTLPLRDTSISYAKGAVGGSATVIHTQRLEDGTLAVLLDETPCHPLDVGWPDQGSDQATIRTRDIAFDVIDCVVGASDGQTLYVGADVPVRRGAEGWAFVVVHILPADAELKEGAEVRIDVEQSYRAALSAGHTGCHLASLALNQVLADQWTKEVRPDALGNPDFDGAAIESSTILEYGSRDVYRLGKSLRKKGFPTESLVAHLPALQDALNQQLVQWVASGGEVRIESHGEFLTDLREWVCELPSGTARIPCGGTHLRSLSQLTTVAVGLELSEENGALQLTMETAAVTL